MKFFHHSILVKLSIPVIGLMLIGTAVIYYLVPQMVEKNAEQNAIAAAEKTVRQFKTIRGYYTKNVIAKVLGNSNMKGSFNHRQESNAIPLPATFIHDLSAMLKEEGTNIGLYSGFPFPNRKDRKLDEFQQSAWAALQKNPDGKMVRSEIVDGKRTVRVAIADRMVAEKCVGCHNSHPDTPKTGWKLGDTRGVLEVATTIDDQILQGLELSRDIIMILGLMLAAISVAFYFVYRRTIGVRMDRTIDVTQRIADGDLTNEIIVDSKDEIGHLQLAIKYLQDNSLKFMEMEAKEKKETEKYRFCLNQANTNLMLADVDLNIIYMNDAAVGLFEQNEADFQKDLPKFDSKTLIGTNIDVFHKNPAHQRAMMEHLTKTIEVEMEIGGRTMKIIASPVNNEGGIRLGTVVEWIDRTEEKALLEREAQVNADNQRIKTALDQVASNVMMADADLNIILLNKTAVDLFEEAEADFQKDLPNFNAKTLVGSNIDVFHKNPAHQRDMLKALTKTMETEVMIGGRTMKLVASPVMDDNGERLGTVAEWIGRTDQVAVEKEIDGIVEAATHGDFNRRIEESDKEGFFQRLAVGINEVMQTTDTSLNDVVRVLQGLAQGDLTQTIEAEYQGLFGTLKSDLNTTVEKLSEVLSNVNSNVSSIADSSEEVSSTAQSLSQGASEQAASVEETSAAIEQMSASINQNNKNAKVTNDIASKSAAEAVEGGDAVKETVQAMNQIASKIGIIEDIAYQTNILALNAAIEAARAGDHGKGFAVVAAEVRKLAERSQVSASEISELASTSVTVAEKAGSLLEEIVPGINKTAGLVQEISAASDEQASGAGQISNAMSQLDQVTQQNASASEELTATAEGMRNQSRSLLEQVGFFKLAGSEPGVRKDRRGEDRAFNSSGIQPMAVSTESADQQEGPDEKQFKRFV